MAKNTELSTSDSVARKVTENPDENVDTGEENYFYDLTIPGAIIVITIFWRKKKKLCPKMMKFGSKIKKREMERESNVNSLR